jgi:hypothetical protein
MKKVIFLLAITFCAAAAFAQGSGQIVVDKSDLPEDLLRQLEKKQKVEQVKENIETAKEVAQDARSIGHEIGVAVDEALGAVTKHAETFGKTDVGKFTMAMVAVSILKDQIPFVYDRIVGLVFGIPFLIFIDIVLFLVFFRTTRQRKRVIIVEGKKTYEYVDTWFTAGPNNNDDVSRSVFIVMFWIIALAANTLIVSQVIF